MSVCFSPNWNWKVDTKQIIGRKSFIHTNECQIKTGCLIYKGPAEMIKILWIFNGLNSDWAQFWSHIKFPEETKEWVLRSPSPFCLPFLNLPVLFDWADWRQYWHCNTLLFLFSDISTFAQLTMAAGRGGGSISDSVCPSSPSTDIYHKAPTFIFAWCLIPPDIYNTSSVF